MSKKHEKPAAEDGPVIETQRERVDREAKERMYGRPPANDTERSAHFWKGVAIVLGLALFFGLLILGSVLGLDGSSDPCQVDANGYLECYFPDP